MKLKLKKLKKIFWQQFDKYNLDFRELKKLPKKYKKHELKLLYKKMTKVENYLKFSLTASLLLLFYKSNEITPIMFYIFFGSYLFVSLFFLGQHTAIKLKIEYLRRNI